ERHMLRYVADDLVAMENHIRSIRVLAHFAVHNATDAECVRVAYLVRSDQVRPERRKLVASFAEQPLRRTQLQIAGGQIVHIAIAEDMIKRGSAINILSRLADYDDKLRFVVDFVRYARQRYFF